MALKSLYKSVSDRLCFYSNWKFNFQKTRVIGSLRYMDEALERFVAAPFHTLQNRGEMLYNEHSLKELNHRWNLYHEDALFLNYIVDKWSFDKSKLSKYELQDYEQAVEKLKKWNEVRVFCEQINWFMGEIRRTIYIRRASSYPNDFYATYFPELEISIVTRYHDLMSQLKDYPEWAEKVRNEVEPAIKQLADHMPSNPHEVPVNIFYGIDLHRHFR